MSVIELFEVTDKVDQTDLQLDTNGRLRHLLTMHGLDRRHITALLDDAETYLSDIGKPVVRSTALQGKDRCQPVFRTQHSYAGIIRSGRQTPRCGCFEPGCQHILQKERREHSRHDIHAAGDAG